MRKAIGWILLIVVAITLLMLLNRDAGDPRTEVPLSEFHVQLLSGNVQEVSLNGDEMVGRLFVAMPRNEGSITAFRVTLPPGMSSSWPFMQWLLENRKGATVAVNNTNSVLMAILVPLVPWLLIFGFIWIFVFRQLRKSGPKAKEPLPVIVMNPGTPDGA